MTGSEPAQELSFRVADRPSEHDPPPINLLDQVAFVRRRLNQGIPQASSAPSTAQMIMTQTSESETWPNRNEILTV